MVNYWHWYAYISNVLILLCHITSHSHPNLISLLVHKPRLSPRYLHWYGGSYGAIRFQSMANHAVQLTNQFHIKKGIYTKFNIRCLFVLIQISLHQRQLNKVFQYAETAAQNMNIINAMCKSKTAVRFFSKEETRCIYSQHDYRF